MNTLPPLKGCDSLRQVRGNVQQVLVFVTALARARIHARGALTLQDAASAHP